MLRGWGVAVLLALASEVASGSRIASLTRLRGGGTTKAFLLDIDGTLCKTDGVYELAFKELLEITYATVPKGTVTTPWYKANVHGGVDSEVFQRLMPKDFGPKELLQVSKDKDALFCKKANAVGCPEIPGLARALAMAKSKGYRCIAVTNAPRGAAELVISSIRRDYAAGDVIEDLVVSAECPRAKPFPDPYEIAMKRLGVEPEDCLVFEDSPSGVKAGVAAKVAGVVGIRTELTSKKLMGAGATVTVADWQEVTPSLIQDLLDRKTLSPARHVKSAVYKAAALFGGKKDGPPGGRLGKI